MPEVVIKKEPDVDEPHREIVYYPVSPSGKFGNGLEWVETRFSLRKTFQKTKHMEIHWLSISLPQTLTMLHRDIVSSIGLYILRNTQASHCITTLVLCILEDLLRVTGNETQRENYFMLHSMICCSFCTE